MAIHMAIAGMGIDNKELERTKIEAFEMALSDIPNIDVAEALVSMRIP